MAALLGKELPNLSAAVIFRLTAEWKDVYDHWQKRDYNTVRPHSSLGYKPPAPEALQWPAFETRASFAGHPSRSARLVM